MEIKIIDSHTHVQFEQFDKDREDVITRALTGGVGMINAGADTKTSKSAAVLANKYSDGVWAAVGIHPTEMEAGADSAQADAEFKVIEKLAEETKVVGIGECGLDYYSKNNAGLVPTDFDRQNQIEMFERHINLSNKIRKPLVIHCREAFADTINVLSANKNKLLPEPGILHFFTGSIEDAHKLLELNFSFTFGGLITFNRSFDEVVKIIPLDKILIETDAPFVSPKSHRGQRNEPSFVSEVLLIIAQIKKIDEVHAQKQILENTKKVFSLK